MGLLTGLITPRPIGLHVTPVSVDASTFMRSKSFVFTPSISHQVQKLSMGVFCPTRLMGGVIALPVFGPLEVPPPRGNCVTWVKSLPMYVPVTSSPYQNALLPEYAAGRKPESGSRTSVGLIAGFRTSMCCG